MTALGKTLTVFVFLLSLVWCWLTVNAYATRTNWKTQVDAAKTQVEAAVSRAREMETALNETKAAAESKAKKQVDIIAKNEATIEGLKKTNSDLLTNYERKLAAERQGEDRMALQSKNNQATSQQLDLAKGRADTLETKLTAATRSEQDAKNGSLQSKLEADSVKARNEQIELQLALLQERMRDMQRGGGGLGATPIVPVRPDLKASVTRVDGDFVTISLGADAGLSKGAILDVARLNPTKFLGKIRIMSVEPKIAVGMIESANGGKVTGDNLPKTGDLVGVFGQ